MIQSFGEWFLQVFQTRSTFFLLHNRGSTPTFEVVVEKCLAIFLIILVHKLKCKSLKSYVGTFSFEWSKIVSIGLAR